MSDQFGSPESRNGRHCYHCTKNFASSEAIEHEFGVLMDNMYGRPPSEVSCVTDVCPHCGSDRIECVELCEDCFEREPAEGDDYCSECAQNRAEAAYERSLGECFRGGEAASYIAEQQAQIKRECK